MKLRVVRAFCSDPAALRCFTLGGGKVAEHELRQLLRLSVLPDAVDVVHMKEALENNNTDALTPEEIACMPGAEA